MEEIKIVDNYMDEREFRNYINTMFLKHHYNPITIDDVRLADSDKTNDNDQRVAKDGVKYTVQSYLNTEITEKQIEETFKDMEKEDVAHGIIVTNFYVKQKIKDKAMEKNIRILDRSEFEDGIYESNN